jgi:hypothetical protein
VQVLHAAVINNAKLKEETEDARNWECCVEKSSSFKNKKKQNTKKAKK